VTRQTLTGLSGRRGALIRVMFRSQDPSIITHIRPKGHAPSRTHPSKRKTKKFRHQTQTNCEKSDISLGCARQAARHAAATTRADKYPSYQVVLQQASSAVAAKIHILRDASSRLVARQETARTRVHIICRTRSREDFHTSSSLRPRI